MSADHLADSVRSDPATAIPAELELYTEPEVADVPYRVKVAHAFTDDERQELAALLEVGNNPYQDYAGFDHAVRARLPLLPRALRDACQAYRDADWREEPVFCLKNCPIGVVPYLDFEDPLHSKYQLKKNFVAEAFLASVAHLQGTSIVTYRTANNGDMFHDIHPLKSLQYSMSQKTANTLHFHTDLPDNRARPDWVNLLSLRNSRKNRVYTAIVRLLDVFNKLDTETLEVLRTPLFRSPKTQVQNNISVYGLEESGFLETKPIIIAERGFEYFCYNESYTVSVSDEGRAALAALRRALHQNRESLFLDEGDFVAICNNTAMHARHVVDVADLDAHRHRWLLKTWNVDDIELHRRHFVPDRINTVDE